MHILSHRDLLHTLTSLSLLFPLPTKAIHHMKRTPAFNPQRRAESVQLVVTNTCGETIYPAIYTGSGTAPETQGFELQSGDQRTLSVSADWQGRVWGRTNCSFNSAGTGPATNGASTACTTGDCYGVVDCLVTGQTPTTLAEFTLNAGDGLTYYDISLVDGYNLPLAIVMHASTSGPTHDIPPNLTNPSCQGTAALLAPPYSSPYDNLGGSQTTFLGTNASAQLPFEDSVTTSYVATWCPWNLQVTQLTGPSDGVYKYPDGNLDRAAFSPCFSSCARFNLPQDCCTGRYNQPSTCSPSEYSKAAKRVCPDAYSYAFDDQTSTFIIPAGAGFEVVFCPGARSTNILAVDGDELRRLAQMSRIRRALGPGFVGERDWS